MKLCCHAIAVCGFVSERVAPRQGLSDRQVSAHYSVLAEGL